MTVIVCTERNEAELRELLINYSIGGCNQADHFVVDVDCHCSVACLLTDQQFAHTHTRTHARTHVLAHENRSERSVRSRIYRQCEYFI